MSDSSKATTRDSDDALDRRARAILEAVRACWRLSSDLDLVEDRMVALDKLNGAAPIDRRRIRTPPGFPVLSQAGKFTIDTTSGQLIFG